MDKNQELWGMALWVEKNHGDKGYAYCEDRAEKFRSEGDANGARLWENVADRVLQLRAGPVMIYGQPETWPN